MLTGLDHIIIGVNDLEQATVTFQQRFGLIPSGGGKHPMGGTANRIIVIGETYIELITVHAAAEAQQSLVARLNKGDGYLNFVLASNDIQADSLAIVERGIKVNGPNVGELRSADGRSRGWVRTDIERPDLAQHYPFLIQHDTTGEERRQRLAGWISPPVHPLGARRVLSATIAVENLAEASQRFQNIYGLEPAFSGDAEGWDARLVAFSLANGDQYFELAAPTTPSGEQGTSLPESGALAQHLQRFGESLCHITLEVEDLAAARNYLDEQQVNYLYRNEKRQQLWLRPDQACGATIILQRLQ